jgi:hypothetical protein
MQKNRPFPRLCGFALDAGLILTKVDGSPFAYVNPDLSIKDGHMCLQTLHDKARNRGLGLMYEKHWKSGFRDLFDQTSPTWTATEIVEKVNDLKAFEAAGVGVDEIIDHYQQTYELDGDPDQVLDRLPATMQRYRDAGYWPRLPDEVALMLHD